MPSLSPRSLSFIFFPSSLHLPFLQPLGLDSPLLWFAPFCQYVEGTESDVGADVGIRWALHVVVGLQRTNTYSACDISVTIRSHLISTGPPSAGKSPPPVPSDGIKIRISLQQVLLCGGNLSNFAEEIQYNKDYPENMMRTRFEVDFTSVVFIMLTSGVKFKK